MSKNSRKIIALIVFAAMMLVMVPAASASYTGRWYSYSLVKASDGAVTNQNAVVVTSNIGYVSVVPVQSLANFTVIPPATVTPQLPNDKYVTLLLDGILADSSSTDPNGVWTPDVRGTKPTAPKVRMNLWTGANLSVPTVAPIAGYWAGQPGGVTNYASCELGAPNAFNPTAWWQGDYFAANKTVAANPVGKDSQYYHGTPVFKGGKVNLSVTGIGSYDVWAIDDNRFVAYVPAKAGRYTITYTYTGTSGRVGDTYAGIPITMTGSLVVDVSDNAGGLTGKMYDVGSSAPYVYATESPKTVNGGFDYTYGQGSHGMELFTVAANYTSLPSSTGDIQDRFIDLQLKLSGSDGKPLSGRYWIQWQTDLNSTIMLMDESRGSLQASNGLQGNLGFNNSMQYIVVDNGTLNFRIDGRPFQYMKVPTAAELKNVSVNDVKERNKNGTAGSVYKSTTNPDILTLLGPKFDGYAAKMDASSKAIPGERMVLQHPIAPTNQGPTLNQDSWIDWGWNKIGWPTVFQAMGGYDPSNTGRGQIYGLFTSANYNYTYRQYRLGLHFVLRPIDGQYANDVTYDCMVDVYNTPIVPNDTFNFNKDTVEITVGQKIDLRTMLQLNGSYAFDKTVSWSKNSGDTTCITLNGSEVTGDKVGYCMVQAKLDSENKVTSILVKVNPVSTPAPTTEVTPTPKGEYTSMIVIANSGLNLRKSASTKGSVVTKMPFGSEVLVKTADLDDGKDWVYLKYTNSKGKSYAGYSSAVYLDYAE